MTLFLTILLALGQAASPKQGKLPKNGDIDNIGNRNINKGSLNFMSLEKELAMGRELAAEVERQQKLLTDATVNEYVNRIGQTIAANSDVKVPITIRVIESDEVNALSLPGGYIFVNTGLIRAADSEAELAFGLAHTVASVAARHGAESSSKGQLLNTATIPLLFTSGPAGYGIREQQSSGALLIPMTSLSFSRKAVSESDFLGIQYLFKSGYDPAAAVSLLQTFQTLEVNKPGSVSKQFSTHPPIAERIEAVQKNINLILPKRPDGNVSRPEFDAIKSRLK